MKMPRLFGFKRYKYEVLRDAFERYLSSLGGSRRGTWQ